MAPKRRDSNPDIIPNPIWSCGILQNVKSPAECQLGPNSSEWERRFLFSGSEVSDEPSPAPDEGCSLDLHNLHPTDLPLHNYAFLEFNHVPGKGTGE